jgi:hypothetical protein
MTFEDSYEANVVYVVTGLTFPIGNIRESHEKRYAFAYMDYIEPRSSAPNRFA